MKILAARFGENADLRAGGASEFRRIGSSQNLHFLSRIDIRGAEACAVRACARGGRAVIGDEVLRVARAVEVGRALREVEVQTRGVAGPGAGRERGETDRVTAVQLEQVDLLTGNQSLVRCGFRLQSLGRCRNFDRFRRGADYQGDVHRERRAGVQLVARGLVLLEAGRFGRDCVESRRNIRDHVKAGIVGVGAALGPSGFILDAHLGLWYDGARRIFHKTRNRTQIRLCESETLLQSSNSSAEPQCLATNVHGSFQLLLKSNQPSAVCAGGFTTFPGFSSPVPKLRPTRLTLESQLLRAMLQQI